MKQQSSFEYRYSAQQQAQVRQIREKYLPPQEDKMTQLLALDASAGKKATMRAITVGLVGALLLGTGMSLTMTELGLPLGSYAMPVGIAVGMAGLALVASAYPLYSRIVKRERKKIAPEILRLSDELLQ